MNSSDTDKSAATADGANKPVRLAERFASSSKFRDLFTTGMDLVEETASYLDGDGRQAAKGLPKQVSALYGTESMRLTTRLMQLASWLLLQRAVAEGEMTVEQALVEKKNVKLNQSHSKIIGSTWSELPHGFVDLVERSISLQRRIVALDDEIYGRKPEAENERHENPVASQHRLLETAFDPKFRY